MPPVHGWKEFRVKFTPDDLPFSRPWSNLPDALDYITYDGDFQGCGLVDLWLEATWREGNRRTSIHNKVNLNAKALKDFKATDSAVEAYFDSWAED
jgi:hypothetical protein